MREIKFRGKDIESGEWLYGDLRQRLGYYPAIIESYCTDEGKVGYREVAVEEETVGQFTGLTDKNGKEIYEGDVARIDFGDTDPFEVDIRWDDEEVSLALYRDGYVYSRPAGLEMVMEVIGNIHDNPELINE